MSLPRTLPILLIAALAGCPADDVGLTDEAGTTTSPDTSTDTSPEETDTSETDASTTDASTTDLACTPAWQFRAPIVHGTQDVSGFTPMVLDGDALVVLHPAGTWPNVDTQVTRVSALDASLLDTFGFSVVEQDDLPQSLALLPGGDLVVGISDYDGYNAWTRRMSPSGEYVWLEFVQNDIDVVGIEVLPDDRLATLKRRAVTSSDSDLLLTLFDSESGDVLDTWQHDTDMGGLFTDGVWALASAAGGELFVAASESSPDVDLRASVYGFAPGSLAAPAWTTLLPEPPSGVATPTDLELGPQGVLYVTHQERSGALMSYLSALDPSDGALLWTIDRTSFGLPEFELAYLRTLAVDAEAIVVAGEGWLPGKVHHLAFVVVLDHEGNLICQTTLDDFNRETGASLHHWSINAAELDASGDLFVSGMLTPLSRPDLPIELLVAKLD